MYPAQPGPPFQAPPFGQQPNRGGNPVGAVFLGLLVSFVVSLLYSGLLVVIVEHLTSATSTTLYLAYALLSGAIVGALIGKVGHRSNGARICAAVIAALGAFFGGANFLPMYIAKERGFFGIRDMLEYDPFFPAKAWWTDGTHGGVDWTSPLALVLAAAAAWGIAYLVGNKRRQA
ncbi:hypothetical protein GCM10010276_81350 [Streptomyces longisporus]|uniref:ABC transporter permease n=2 Tax=Streptomyces longisporus TaxID=1948 RepID=A0ABP6ANA6_STRLO